MPDAGKEVSRAIPPGTRITILMQMQASEAFALLCERWDEQVSALEGRIFDPATDNETTRHLKGVRKELVEHHHPRALVETMIKIARTDATRG